MIRMNAFTPVPAAEETTPVSCGSADQTAMLRAIERLAAAGRDSAAEVLSTLRREFPYSPLAVRVRALEALRRR
jgi:hypothetical protein